MISPAILACAPAGGGPAPYHADAVHVDNTTPGNVFLQIDALVSTDNTSFSFAGWVNFDGVSTSNGPILYVSDPQNGYSNYLGFGGETSGNAPFSVQIGNNDGSILESNDGAAVVPLTGWHCLIISMDSSAEGIGRVYLGDVDVTGAFNQWTTDFNCGSNGLQFFLFSDTFGDDFSGDAADWRPMPGQSLLVAGDIPLLTRRLFIDGSGKPVDPAVATLALGAPCMLFSGDATGFPINQGTGGGFTLTGGPLTNASSSPSD